MQILLKALSKIFYFLIFTFIILSILPYFFPLNVKDKIDNRVLYKNSEFTNIDHVNLHYRIFSPELKKLTTEKTDSTEKRGVLMLHGFAGNTYCWQKNVDSLTKRGFFVVLVDMPAFGFSDKSTKISYSNSFKATLFWKLLKNIGKNIEEKAKNSDKFHIKKWHLVGHSMGAGTALAMAHQNPENTDKIVLVGGAYSGKMQSGFLGYVLAYPPLVRWIEVYATNYLYSPAYFEKLLGSAYSQKPIGKDVQGYYLPFEQDKNITRGILAMARNNGDNVKMDFTHLQGKITLIWGENDKWVPKAVGERFVKKYPKATLKIIQGGGHCTMETHHKEFNILLKEIF